MLGDLSGNNTVGRPGGVVGNIRHAIFENFTKTFNGSVRLLEFLELNVEAVPFSEKLIVDFSWLLCREARACELGNQNNIRSFHAKRGDGSGNTSINDRSNVLEDASRLFGNVRLSVYYIRDCERAGLQGLI